MPLDDVSEGRDWKLPRRRRMVSGGVALAVREQGRPGAVPVLLLHGYPDSMEVWDAVAEALADDCHVIRYDVRGAGASDRPSRRRDYRLPLLADDLRAVIDAVVPGHRVHLVAHDWGSIQAWEALGMADAPQRFASFLSLSGPCLDHIGEYLRGLRRGTVSRPAFADQLRRSWYIALFQLPWIPEIAWRAGLGRHWPKLLARSEGIRAAASPTQTEDGATGPQLYRANVLPRLLRPQPREVTVPLRVLILRNDPHVSPALMRALLEFQSERLPRRSVRELPGGHWLPLANPRLLVEEIRHWLAAQTAVTV